MFCEDTKDKRENNAGRSTNTTGNISCLRGYFHLRQIPVFVLSAAAFQNLLFIH